jgi:hypothetical protein
MASYARAVGPAFARPNAAARSGILVPWLARLAKERLVQFAFFGGAIFFVSSRLQRSADAIAFTGSELTVLRDAEAQRKGLDGSPTLVGEVKERALEDEILYREGLKLGFDKDDGVVRQRVIQKTLFLAEELAGAGEPPADDELRRFFDSTRSEWRRPEQWRFRHVFARDRAALEGILERVAGGERVDRLGDPCPVPREASMSSDRLSSLLGADFVVSLQKAPRDSFGPPIRSALGWHIVRVEDHSPEALATFEEAKGALRGAYVVKRRQQAVATYLQRAFEKYTVTIDGERVSAIEPHGRLALRSAGSAED